MEKLLNECKSFFKSKGLRFTPQRKALIQEIASMNSHFDVDLVYAKLRDKNIDISKATIYRALPLLEQCGIIKEVTKIENKSYYEYSYQKGHHDHMICQKCGKIIEFHNKDIEELQYYICDDFNFTPHSHRLIIKGICSECRRDKDE